MTLLDEPAVSGRADAPPAPTDPTIDLTSDARHPDPPAAAGVATSADRDATAEDGRVPPARPARAANRPLVAAGHVPLRGMRVRRVRLGSVAVVAAVFWTLGFLVVVGTAVALWNVAQTLGFVTEIEDLLVTSLGLEAFQIDGDGLFTVVSVGAGIIAAIGWLLTVLLAAVYNATSALFGGLALETGPLQRHQRVLSLRHRRFVAIRS